MELSLSAALLCLVCLALLAALASAKDSERYEQCLAERRGPAFQCMDPDSHACKKLQRYGFGVNSTVNGLRMEKCIVGGFFYETWRVRGLAFGKTPMVLKLASWKLDDWEWIPPFLREHLVWTKVKECTAMQWLRQHDPKHYPECLDEGVLPLTTGALLPFVLIVEAPGRSLSHGLRSKARQMPRYLADLDAVFATFLRLFDLLDEGIRPRGTSRVRYYIHDFNTNNVLLSDDGEQLTLIDHDRTGMCCEDQSVCEEKDFATCGPLFDRWHKEIITARLVDTFLSMIILPPRPEKGGIEPHEFSMARLPEHYLPGQAVITRWCCISLWRALWWMFWKTPDDAMVEIRDFWDSVVRPSYKKDWEALGQRGPELLLSALTAVDERDVTWPPRFVEMLQDIVASKKGRTS